MGRDVSEVKIWGKAARSVFFGLITRFRILTQPLRQKPPQRCGRGNFSAPEGNLTYLVTDRQTGDQNGTFQHGGGFRRPAGGDFLGQ